MSCIVPGCVNNHRRSIRENGATLFRFPTDEAGKAKWVKALNLEGQNLRHSNVCSLHFSASEIITTKSHARLAPTAVPTKRPYKERKSTKEIKIETSDPNINVSHESKSPRKDHESQSSSKPTHSTGELIIDSNNPSTIVEAIDDLSNSPDVTMNGCETIVIESDESISSYPHTKSRPSKRKRKTSSCSDDCIIVSESNDDSIIVNGSNDDCTNLNGSDKHSTSSLCDTPSKSSIYDFSDFSDSEVDTESSKFKLQENSSKTNNKANCTNKYLGNNEYEKYLQQRNEETKWSVSSANSDSIKSVLSEEKYEEYTNHNISDEEFVDDGCERNIRIDIQIERLGSSWKPEDMSPSEEKENEYLLRKHWESPTQPYPIRNCSVVIDRLDAPTMPNNTSNNFNQNSVKYGTEESVSSLSGFQSTFQKHIEKIRNLSEEPESTIPNENDIRKCLKSLSSSISVKKINSSTTNAKLPEPELVLEPGDVYYIEYVPYLEIDVNTNKEAT